MTTSLPPYEFVRNGRSWATVLAVTGVWLLAIVLWIVLDVSSWVVLILLLFSIPAALDVFLSRHAGARLDDTTLEWFSGARKADVALQEIAHIRLVTRLDFSVRAAVVLKTGQKLRLPAESTPPSVAFENALTERAIRSERHHFTFL